MLKYTLTTLGLSLLLAYPLPAQSPPPVRHVCQPTSWNWYPTCNLPTSVSTAQANQQRILDLTHQGDSAACFGITQISAAVIGNGGPYDVDWDVDWPVSEQGAIVLAQATNMRIATVDGRYDASSGQVVFASLREAIPGGFQWEWIPHTDPTSILAWLSSHAEFSPYAVDSVETPQGREYTVLAMAGPDVRKREVVFGRTLGELETLARQSDARVTDLDQSGADSFDGILEWPAPGEIPHFMDIQEITTALDGHGQMERICARTSWDDQGTPVGHILRVNNAWSLYDIHDYILPPPGYRGCPGTLGMPTMTVRSSTPGVAHPGSTLDFIGSPCFPTSLNFLIIGFNRRPLDLGPAGAPGCWLIPTANQLNTVTAGGSSALSSLTLPPSSNLLGFRFYAQYALSDPLINNLGYITSNAFMITIQ